MIKQIEVSKTFTVQEHVRHCDICEEIIKEDDVYVTVNAALCEKDARSYSGIFQMELCLECLAHKGQAAKFVIDTKVSGEVRSKHTRKPWESTL